MAGINTKGKMEITQLDFDTIKGNLKTYMKGQTTFTDYDFEGSGLNVLLDVLSYGLLRYEMLLFVLQSVEKRKKK